MADTKKTLSALQTLLADNTTGNISAQDVRDFLVTVYGSWITTSKTYANSPYTNTLDDTVLVFDGTSGAIVHNIYGDEGKVLIVQATGANYVTVTAGGVETIAGAATFVVPVGSYAIFCKVGSVWSVFSPLATNGNLLIPGLSGTSRIYLDTTSTSITKATAGLTITVSGTPTIVTDGSGHVAIGTDPTVDNSVALKVDGDLTVTGTGTLTSSIINTAQLGPNAFTASVGIGESGEIGFFGATPVAQQTSADWTTLANLVTALKNLGLIADA